MSEIRGLSVLERMHLERLSDSARFQKQRYEFRQEATVRVHARPYDPERDDHKTIPSMRRSCHRSRCTKFATIIAEIETPRSRSTNAYCSYKHLTAELNERVEEVEPE